MIPLAKGDNGIRVRFEKFGAKAFLQNFPMRIVVSSIAGYQALTEKSFGFFQLTKNEQEAKEL